jgi:uncharacterized protein (TIGR02246 family)
MFRSVRVAIACLCLVVLSLSANAAESRAEKAIRERISALEKAWEKGDAAFAASQVYGTDAVIQGEGQKETVHSAAAVLDVVTHLMADSRQVRLDIHSIRILGPAAAHSWVTWQVTPKAAGEKPFAVRALFVWSKGREGWRIRADMYSMGSM